MDDNKENLNPEDNFSDEQEENNISVNYSKLKNRLESRNVNKNLNKSVMKKKGKVARKNLLKNGINGLLKAVGKAITKIVTNPIFWKIAIPVIIILVIAMCVLALIDRIVQLFNIDLNSSVDNITTTSYYNSLSAEDKAEVDSSLEIFNQKGTTLTLSVDTISNIISENQDLENKTGITDVDRNLYYVLEKEYGTASKDANGLQTLDTKTSLYSHILYIDKYNFNNIKWKSFGHGYTNTDITTFNYDLEKNLKIPQDPSNTSLDTFINLTSPYLLNYRIPSTFLTAMSLMNCNEDIAYQIMRHCQSDITVNRYDMQTLSVNTKYDEYDQYSGYSRVSITVDSSGNMSLNSVGFIEDTSNSEHINDRLDENGNIVRTKETEVDRNANTTYSYYIKEAKTFDVYRQCDFEYTPYSESDVSSVINYDSEAEIDVQPFKSYSDESLVYNESNFSLNGCINIEDVKNKYNLSQQGNSVRNSNGSTTYYLVTPDVTVKNGDTHYINRIWSDKLSQTKSENRNYTIQDIIDFNKNTENDPNKTTISEEDFREDTNSFNEYTEIADDDEMNLFIMMNSNPKIYLTYASSRYKYMGMDVNLLYTTYRQLLIVFSELEDELGVVPFIYGHSFGLENTYMGENALGNGLGGFIWPVPAYVERGLNMQQQITSWFGWRGAIAGTNLNSANFHTGLDISAGGSPPIVAARDGIIAANSYQAGGAGNYIAIKHDNGYYTLYAHLSTVDKSLVPGTRVTAGQQIGIMGTTGNSTGVHLHFEIIETTEDSKIWVRENKRDPKDFFNDDCSGKGLGGSLAGIEIGTALNSANYTNAAKYLPYAQKWGEKYGIDPYLIIAMIAQESGGNPTASAGTSGGQGLMQIEKSVYLNTTITCTYLDGSSEQVVATMANLNNPDINIQIGCQQLRNKIDSYNGNLLVALQAYNYGSGGIRRCISYYISQGKNTEDRYCGVSQEEYVKYLASNDTGWLSARQWYSDVGCTAFGSRNLYHGDPNYLSHIFRYYNTQNGMPYFYTKDGNKVQYSAN